MAASDVTLTLAEGAKLTDKALRELWAFRVAIMRLKASELPRQFRLDDSLGMSGGPALSAAPQVKIEARISKSGEAVPKPGDLRGESAVVAPGAGNIEIVIDRSVP